MATATTIAALARALCRDRPQVYRWKRDSTFPQRGPGGWDVEACARWAENNARIRKPVRPAGEHDGRKASRPARAAGNPEGIGEPSGALPEAAPLWAIGFAETACLELLLVLVDGGQVSLAGAIDALPAAQAAVRQLAEDARPLPEWFGQADDFDGMARELIGEACRVSDVAAE